MRLASVLTLAVWAMADAAVAQQLSSADSHALSFRIRKDAADLAYRRCLASQETTRESQLSIVAAVRSLLRRLTGGLAFTDRQRVTRGAIDLPASVRVAADEATRSCLLRITPVIEAELLADVQRANAPAPGSGGYPGAIELQFTYRRTASLDETRYSDALRVSLAEGGRNRPSRPVASDTGPDGSPLFYYTYAPFPGARVQGRISAKPVSSRLTADQVPHARICFERVPAPLPPPPPEPDLFACVEGGVCRPAGATRRWLRMCPGLASQDPSLLKVQFAALRLPQTSDVTADHGGERRWITPSVDTLAAEPGQQVGWSYFKLRTEAFRQPDVEAVEVALAVNGVAVDEDGLRPAERPEPNDPAFPFDLLFALQTLNFEGRRGGCDTVSVSMTPLLTDGRRGAPVTADLSYVALRDQPDRVEQTGGGALTWSASVIRPVREWRHWAFLRSYTFQYGDAVSQQAAVARVTADKDWLDRQGWTYGGAPLRGIIRPPLTIRGTSASYGLAAGLLQPSGQVRFTFSENEARALGRWMVDQRGLGAEAARVIEPVPYLFQSPPGRAITPAGLCPVA